MLIIMSKEEKYTFQVAYIYPIRSQCTLSLPPDKIIKPYGFLMFSGGRKRVHLERMGEIKRYPICQWKCY